MIVCAKCRIELQCSKTGRSLVYRNNTVYRGDEFTCKKCGATIVYLDPNYLSHRHNLEKALQALEDQGPINMSDAD